MSKTGIIIVAILVTLGLTYGLSLLLTRRKTKTGGSVSADDWEVGGRELPLYVVVGTQFATAMGGGILVGQVGNGFNNGLSCLLYGILCQLAFIVLMFIAKWLRSHQFATVPEILTHYTGQSKAVRIIAGVMTIVVPFGWCCSNLTAFAKLYSPITGLSIKCAHYNYGRAESVLHHPLRSENGRVDRFYLWLSDGGRWCDRCRGHGKHGRRYDACD